MTWLVGLTLLVETELKIIPEIIFSLLNILNGLAIFAFHVILSKAKRDIWQEFVRKKSHKLRNDIRSMSKLFRKDYRSAFRPVKKTVNHTHPNSQNQTKNHQSSTLFTITNQTNEPTLCHFDTATSATVNFVAGNQPMTNSAVYFDPQLQQKSHPCENDDESLKFKPISRQKCRSFSSVSVTSQKSIPIELDLSRDVAIKLKNCCSTPANETNSANYFSDDISARINRLNASLRRIKSKEENKPIEVDSGLTPISFKLDDLPTLFLD